MRPLGALVAGRRPRRRSRDLAPAQVELPVLARAAGDDLEVVEPAPEDLEFADVEIDAAQRRGGVVAGGRGRLVPLAQRQPVVDVERGQLAAYPDAGAVGPHSVGAPHGAAERQQGAIDVHAILAELAVRDDLH